MTDHTMRAIVQDRYGTSAKELLRLAHIERPQPEEDQVLVRVHAAGVSRATWHLMTGRPYLVRAVGFGLRGPKRSTPGGDLSGVVTAVGSQVTEFSPGDEVFGSAVGAFAEYAVARTRHLALKPDSLNFVESSVVPDSALTALQAVRDHARIRSGEKLLVIGASGGVGTYAVQIANHLGAEVTGMCSGPKADLVRSLGASEVIDYADESPLPSAAFDAIIDMGGNRHLRVLRRALKPQGRLVLVGGEESGPWLGGIQRNVWAALWSPFIGQQLTAFIASVNAKDLRELRELIDSGAVKPALERTFELEEAAEALDYLAAGRVRGKVSLTVT
ncbi:NAD(P)-dependent alcohol dehydrogenase [Natronoglycomyces albus]|uniref:NAD(P)-dependent alcohol dehydrogenase n=1 Tax=Natronoglycomyces albus TaxID=2811108 RepID=A0A895XTG0_9ACTN|nr:NAD(P)-dependent alcohol dehydrogenase [Natronoglycomyces albus]QSB04918.1 NAD(P)-dependent alcohol dehydrogenase [Natronoglycomyces albus]